MVFFQRIPQGLIPTSKCQQGRIHYKSLVSGVRNHGQHPYGVNLLNKRVLYHVSTWHNMIAKATLNIRDTPKLNTPSLPSFRCFAFLMQFLGLRSFSTSLYGKKEIVNFFSKMEAEVCKDLLYYLSSDPDNRTFPSCRCEDTFLAHLS